ncbi:MAG TPA: Ig-like domain-containing protein [Longimicrobium sp.]
MALAFGAAVFAACSDRNPLLRDGAVGPPPPVLAAVQCHVSVASKRFTCDVPVASSNARGDVIVGGQNLFVRLTSTNVSFDVDTLRADVTLQNLMFQPIGTTDSTTIDAGGNKIFFHSGPTVTAGSGTVEVVTPDTGTFTATNQPFYRYVGILRQNETSGPEEWKFHLSPGVEGFSFIVYVSAPMPREDGYIDVTPAHPSRPVGGTVQLTGVPRTAAGTLWTDTITWSSQDPSIATVNPTTGLVTAVAVGTTRIIATSTSRPGRTGYTQFTTSPAGAADQTPPTLTTLSITPRVVAGADSSSTVVVTFSATDAGGTTPSGMATVISAVTFITPSGFFVGDAGCLRTAGTASNGTWQCTVSVPQFSDPGSWKIYSLVLTDQQSNVRVYSAEDLRAAGFPQTVLVRGVTDAAGPSLTAFSFAPDTVDVTSTPDTTIVTLSVTDPIAGVGSLSIFLTSPTDKNSAVNSACTLASGTEKNGTYTCPVVIPQFVEAGDWTVTEVALQDKAGNDSIFDTAALQARGFETDLHVLSNEDDTAPSLTAFSFAPDSVDVQNAPDTVTVTLTATDAQAGVGSASVEFQSPGGGGVILSSGACTLTSGTAQNGTYSCQVIVPEDALDGTWTVRQVTLTDNADNTAVFNTAALTGAGFFVELEVVGSAESSPPSLVDFSFSPDTVFDIDVAPDTVTVLVTASDPGSGVDSVSVSFTSPSAATTITVADCPRISGTDASGTWECLVVIPQGSENGNWTVSSLRLKDFSGNIATFGTASLTGRGFETVLVVTNNPAPPPPAALRASRQR